VPGETVKSAVEQIQSIINELSATDPEFKAKVEVKTATEVSYTGVSHQAEKSMEHPVLRAAAKALESVGQKAEYGYWDFGTDASKTAGIDNKPTLGYSPMQEEYAHTPFDKVRIDFMAKALTGNTAIYLSLSECSTEDFLAI
jgi:acetylornithine deacetylase/succinyl-diaminopimelate desuccinylase-like protein